MIEVEITPWHVAEDLSTHLPQPLEELADRSLSVSSLFEILDATAHSPELKCGDPRCDDGNCNKNARVTRPMPVLGIPFNERKDPEDRGDEVIP